MLLTAKNAVNKLFLLTPLRLQLNSLLARFSGL
jgi:hypothetical protein